jgi:hypothetical protein
LHASVKTAEVFVEVEIVHNTSGGSGYRAIWRGTLLANRLTSSNWSINNDLALVSGETTPSSAVASVTLTLDLSGVQLADVAVNIAPGSPNVNQSIATVSVRIFGGGRFA